jgi:hypothetical protein
MSTEKHIPPYWHQSMVSTGTFAWLAAQASHLIQSVMD